MEPEVVRIVCGLVGVAFLILIVKRRRSRQQQ